MMTIQQEYSALVFSTGRGLNFTERTGLFMNSSFLELYNHFFLYKQDLNVSLGHKGLTQFIKIPNSILSQDNTSKSSRLFGIVSLKGVKDEFGRAGLCGVALLFQDKVPEDIWGVIEFNNQVFKW